MADLATLLAAARRHREAGAWGQALQLYNRAAELSPASFEIKHNMALCYLGGGNEEAALRYSREALALKPDLWQSHIIQAKIFRAGQRTEEAAGALKAVLKYVPGNGHALLALADIEINEYGDPLSAISRVAPLHRLDQHKADAELTTLMAKLYDRDESDAELSAALRSFAGRELTLPGFSFSAGALGAKAKASGKPRVGLLSPLFCMSPVYFLTIGALRALSRQVDLVMFNRGSRVDWATRAFRTIAREWYDAPQLAAPALANMLKQQQVDVLFDLGGWMDPVGLKALSARPAPRMYKWVGGQSATTGMAVFDGFITDDQQSVEGAQALHSEPLVSFPGGYVTYEPNFAAADVPLPDADMVRKLPIGVIGNPAKISRAFLAMLEARLDEISGDVAFVDRRYKHAATSQRIIDALPRRHRARLRFHAPADHAKYLRAVREPGRILDTFPYNGGLTSLEALHLGKTVEISSGQLFASRHTQSHFHYWNAGGEGGSLRRDHARLAASLLALIRG